MKNFTLLQASAGFEEGVDADLLRSIEEAGFKVRTGGIIENCYSGRLRRYVSCYDNVILTITGLADLLQFINYVGKVIIDEDSITIYDDYVE